MTTRQRKSLTVGAGCLVFVLVIAFGVWRIYSQLQPKITSMSNVNAETRMVVFDDPKLDFVMEYPQPWSADRLPFGFHGDNTAKASIDSIGAGAFIREVAYTEPVSLERIMKDRQEQWRSRTEEFDEKLTWELLALTPRTVNDIPMLVAEYKTQTIGNTVFDEIFGPRTNYVTEVYFQQNATAYIVTLTVNEANYPQLEDVFQRMIQSIRFRN